MQVAKRNALSSFAVMPQRWVIEPPTAAADHSMTASALYAPLLAAHQNALAAMQSALSAQARQYVASIDSQAPPSDALTLIDQAARQYEAAIKQAIQKAASTINGLAGVIESNLKRDGWIMMGAWYQTFAQVGD